MSYIVDVYKQAIRSNFTFLKNTTQLNDLYIKSLPLEGNKGYLLPISQLHLSDDALIQKLAQWRKENAFAYPSQFAVTFESTKQWLHKNVLDVEDRILFLVADEHGHLIGHLGYANGLNDFGELEIDNVVRGVDKCSPGIMSLAMKKILDWAEEIISPSRIFLRVMDDNLHAISFYKKLSFVEDERIPLKKFVEGEHIIYRPQAHFENTPDKHFLRMNYMPKRSVDVSKLILTAGPSITSREMSYVADATRHGWNNQWNSYIKRFEDAFSEYLNVPYVLSTSSCTGALHIALLALDIGPGDEVIVPDITWVATANAVVYVGATPVFADVDPETWCIDPESFQSLITERTKAVMPVHLYGHPANMEKIMKIARKNKLYVVEDAAPAIGAQCNGQKVGTFGDFSAFSFQGAKLVVTGEGGMLTTQDKALYEKAYRIWDQGRQPSTFWINQSGVKYKMSNVQAAIGLGQLERVNELIAAKRRIFSWYKNGLSDIPQVTLNHEAEWAFSIYWMTSILLDPCINMSAADLSLQLKNKNIDTRPVFPAISQYPHWPRKQTPRSVAFDISQRAINLPSGVCLKKEEVNHICNIIKEILGSRLL